MEELLMSAYAKGGLFLLAIFALGYFSYRMVTNVIKSNDVKNDWILKKLELSEKSYTDIQNEFRAHLTVSEDRLLKIIENHNVVLTDLTKVFASYNETSIELIEIMKAVRKYHKPTQ